MEILGIINGNLAFVLKYPHVLRSLKKKEVGSSLPIKIHEHPFSVELDAEARTQAHTEHTPNVIVLIFLSVFTACSQTQTFLLQQPLTVKNVCFHSQHLKSKTDTQQLNERARRSENIVLMQNSYSLSCLFPEKVLPPPG